METQEEVKLATGLTIGMREANAEDEGVLTKQGYKEDNTSVARYLSNIITHVDGNDIKLQYSQIMDWPIADKYLAFLHSRIKNYGSDLEFKYKFEDGLEISLTQDLNEFLDLKDKGCKPYPFQKETKFDFATSTGKMIKYKLLNSYGEKLIAQKERESLNVLDIFKSRFLEWDPVNNGAWIVVENFRDFSVKESVEIRKHIASTEVNFDLYIEVNHPTIPKYNTYINLMHIPDFLAPLGI